LTERLEALRKVGWPPEPVPIAPLAALLLIVVGLALLWRAARERGTQVEDSTRAPL
jgi:hypothetical protein